MDSIKQLLEKNKLNLTDICEVAKTIVITLKLNVFWKNTYKKEKSEDNVYKVIKTKKVKNKNK